MTPKELKEHREKPETIEMYGIWEQDILPLLSLLEFYGEGKMAPRDAMDMLASSLAKKSHDIATQFPLETDEQTMHFLASIPDRDEDRHTSDLIPSFGLDKPKNVALTFYLGRANFEIYVGKEGHIRVLNPTLEQVKNFREALQELATITGKNTTQHLTEQQQKLRQAGDDLRTSITQAIEEAIATGSNHALLALTRKITTAQRTFAPTEPRL